MIVRNFQAESLAIFDLGEDFFDISHNVLPIPGCPGKTCRQVGWFRKQRLVFVDPIMASQPPHERYRPPPEIAGLDFSALLSIGFP